MIYKITAEKKTSEAILLRQVPVKGRADYGSCVRLEKQKKTHPACINYLQWPRSLHRPEKVLTHPELVQCLKDKKKVIMKKSHRDWLFKFRLFQRPGPGMIWLSWRQRRGVRKTSWPLTAGTIPTPGWDLGRTRARPRAPRAKEGSGCSVCSCLFCLLPWFITSPWSGRQRRRLEHDPWRV